MFKFFFTFIGVISLMAVKMVLVPWKSIGKDK
jgi:hypothetical protein